MSGWSAQAYASLVRPTASGTGSGNPSCSRRRRTPPHCPDTSSSPMDLATRKETGKSKPDTSPTQGFADPTTAKPCCLWDTTSRAACQKAIPWHRSPDRRCLSEVVLHGSDVTSREASPRTPELAARPWVAHTGVQSKELALIQMHQFPARSSELSGSEDIHPREESHSSGHAVCFRPEVVTNTRLQV